MPVGASAATEPTVVPCGAMGVFSGTQSVQTAVFQYAFGGTPTVETLGSGAVVRLAGHQTWLSTGDPVVPVRIANILLPQGMRISSVEARYLDKGVVIGAGQPLVAAPAATPFGPSDTAALAAADWNTLFSRSLNQQDAASFLNQTVCGYNIGTLRVFPVEYVAISQTLVFHTSVSVTVTATWEGLPELPPSPSAADQQRVLSLVENPEAVAGCTIAPATTADPYEYVIVTSSALASSFEPLLAHKLSKGLTGRIATTEWITANYAGTESHDTADRIRQFLADAYANHGTRWVLLGGDVEVVPHRGVRVSVGSTVDNALPTDLYYACLDGPWNSDGDAYWGESHDGTQGRDIDLAPDIYVGRAPVSNATEAANFVAKTIRYETTPHPNATTAVWLGERLDSSTLGSYSGMAIRNQCIPDAWTVLERYDTFSTTWSGATFLADLNNSPHLVNHLGHANETYNARLTSTQVAGLTNSDPYFMYSQGCMSGSLDTHDVCIAEQHVVGAHGAVGVVMNSRYGWYMPGSTPGASHYYALEFWDAVFNEGKVHFGEANQDSKDDNLFRVSADGVYRWIHFETNLFGDPETSFQIGGRPPGSGGTIRGHVYVDANADGQHQPGETGAANHTLYLDLDQDGQLDQGTLIAVSTDVPKTIPDNGTVRSTLTVRGASVITDLNLTLSISHTYAGDLVATLISPWGTRVQLFANVGGSGDGFLGTIFDDEASTPITAGTAPFSGRFRPAQPLARFDGELANGTWTLEIQDTMAWDTGTLQSWSLEITCDEPVATTDAHGAFAFTALADGQYAVRHVVPSGWRDTAPASGVHVVTIAGGNIVENIDFLSADGAPPPATDLGTVDYLQINGAQPNGGELWYRLRASHTGYLSVAAQAPYDQENLVVRLYDSQGQLLATSQGWTAGRRADVTAQAGAAFYVAITADAPAIDLKFCNQVWDSGSGLVAYGSAADDFYTLAVTTSYVLTINTFDYTAARTGPAMTFTFDGGSGSDTAVVVASASDDTAVLRPNAMTLAGPDYDVQILNTETNVALGGGGNDVAHLYDSAGDDGLVINRRYGELCGTGYYLRVETFAIVHGYGLAGGYDVAHLYDSPGDDTFIGRADSSILRGDGFYYRAKGFEEVHGYGLSGGYDSAQLYGSAQSDLFTARPSYSLLQSDAYAIRAKGFESVRCQAGSGGTDTARLVGSAQNESLTATARFANLQASAYEYTAAGFAQIAVSSGGGQDQAFLEDTSGNDVLIASPSQATLTGSGYSLSVAGYRTVRAASTQGGYDVAHLCDSAGDDVFVAHPTWATLSGTSYSLRAEAFDEVHGYASSGYDVAHLYDSAGSDRFVGRDTWSRMVGDGFLNRAKGFDRVFAQGGAGGYDQAWLYDSPGNDHLSATGRTVRLTYAAAAVDLSELAYVRAICSSGGTDTKSTSNVLFKLDCLGPWQTV